MSERLAYTVVEASEVTGISRATIYRLINTRQLHARKVGASWIISRSALEEFLAADGHASVNTHPERLAALN